MTEEQKEAIRKTAKRPEVRLKKSISGNKYYSDPDNRAKMSEGMKKVYQEHPEYGKKRSEKLKEYYSNPENRLKHKMALDKFRSSTEYRKRVSESVKRAWANRTTEEREKVVAKYTESNRREDKREKLAIAIRKRTTKSIQESLSNYSGTSRRAIQTRAKRHKFYEERDQYYLMTKKIDNARTYGLITEAEAFIRFFSKRT